ncbi:MAG: PQQ-dependent sugar dehydrogenase [Planctomycetes bacterium]|nr:PQQ-dependent sugar dehydrogenase [Planctomycetota bacterium]
MRRAHAWTLVALGSTAAALALSSRRCAADPPPPPARIRLERVAGGLRSPVHLTHAGDGSGRLYVVEQEGRIRLVEGDAARPEPFLDIAARVRSGGEMGLLSVAFHPRYPADRRLYVNYTRRKQGARRGLETVVAELRAGEDGARALPDERVLLTIDQPWENHNGGQLVFGADGYLYIGMGDGGSGGDPLDAGQRTDTLLGKLLRIDVEPAGDRPYGVPADNPFVKGPHLPEVWASGLRNPWRFSFDRARSERLFAGDVGQNAWEAVYLVQKGDNCGWRLLEGSRPFKLPKGFDTSGLRMPIAEYGRHEGQSVTGGFVYRGEACPSLVGKYVFTDFYPSAFWTLTEQPDGTWRREEVGRHDFQVSSFGEDERGELYVVDYGGVIYRVAEAARF